jgi:SAM-dependent methyltransferase
MVDWDERLGHESSFFQRAFQSVHAQSVLDCACGTGHHACLFARWGMDVSASDVSEQMIQKSTHLAATRNLSIDFHQASFDQLSQTFDQRFDAVVCVGNSLSAAGSRSAAAEGINQMQQVLRPDGVLIVQVLNYERFPPGQPAYGDPLHRQHLGQDYLFMKAFRRAGTRCDMDIIVLTDGATGQWGRTVFTERLLVVDRDGLVEMLEQAGLSKTKLYGGHDMTPFKPKTSRDLIAVARRE